MWHDWMGLHAGWWGSGGLMLGLIVMVVVFMRRDERPRLTKTPMEILDGRLAAGEVTRDEYREIVGELKR